jgi:hypothetical protein
MPCSGMSPQKEIDVNMLNNNSFKSNKIISASPLSSNGSSTIGKSRHLFWAYPVWSCWLQEQPLEAKRGQMRRNKSILQWKPQPICKPLVYKNLGKLNALSRSAECFRYFVLSVEFWLSPNGDVREWLRNNVLLAVTLIIPALFVMPIIGLILWQLMGWLSMLQTIAGKLIVLPILFLVALLIIKTVIALLKR